MTPSTRRVRRDHAGGKRPEGRRLQREGRRVRRADPRRISSGEPDPGLTGASGLVPFGRFLRDVGIDTHLARLFDRLKSGAGVVYPMASQLRLLIDANVVGEERVFGIDALAGDRLFAHLAGGYVPSIDTVYRDLARFDREGLAALEDFTAKQGLELLRSLRPKVVHLDIDTTVEVLFGAQEGAKPGPNPRYHGRPSYHPVVAYAGEASVFVGGLLRPGDTGFGGAEAPLITRFIQRLRAAVGSECTIYVRIDAAGDCTELLQAIERAGALYLVKARMSSDLCAAIQQVPRWHTSDIDAAGEPTEQWADVGFVRKEWHKQQFYPRVVALRSLKRESGKQLQLWDDADWTTQAYLTNERLEDGASVAKRYDARAGIEPAIGELKHGWGCGKVPSATFAANHAAFLLKMLAWNLLRRWVAAQHADLLTWRVPWLRRVLVTVPGRLVRSGRCWSLRVARPQRIWRDGA